MPDRVDALGPDGGRLLAFKGGILDSALDEELQDIVADAAAKLRAPISLVSLILHRIQYFRAFYGLPKDLATARATDRDVSFCQFVVRDEAPVEVTDAAADGRVPQDLVARYGIRSYLGIPVRADGSVIGSLCVIDTTPRAFTPEERALLTALAERASRRLTVLARAEKGTGATLLKRGTAPVFEEIRNLLQPLLFGVTAARVAALELDPIARLAETLPTDAPVWGVLTTARSALADLRAILDSLQQTTERLRKSVVALQDITSPSTMLATAAQVIETATTLAHHRTKIVGGVQVVPGATCVEARVPRILAVAALSAVFSAVADRPEVRTVSRGIALDAKEAGDALEISIQAPGLDASGATATVAQLEPLVSGDGTFGLVADGARIVLSVPRA